MKAQIEKVRKNLRKTLKTQNNLKNLKNLKNLSLRFSRSQASWPWRRLDWGYLEFGLEEP